MSADFALVVPEIILAVSAMALLMFGAYGGAIASTCLTFVSQAALNAGVHEKLGLKRRAVAVKNTRAIGKCDMVLNDYLPVMEVDSQTYEVRAGWAGLASQVGAAAASAVAVHKGAPEQRVQRADHRVATAPDHMSVDLRGAHVPVAQLLLPPSGATPSRTGVES